MPHFLSERRKTMALITCRECGNQVSDKAATCPHCGAPVVMRTMEEPKIICEECGNEIPSGAEICPNCGAPVAQPTETHKIPIMPSLAAADIPRTAAASTYDPDSESKTQKIAGLAALILMVLSAIGLLFFNTIDVNKDIFKHDLSISVWTIVIPSDEVIVILNDFGIGEYSLSGLYDIWKAILIISVFAFCLVIAAAVMFLTPRKNDIKYVLKVKLGWYIMLTLGAVYSIFGIISVISLKTHALLSGLYDYNVLFYILLSISFGIIVMSAIMIFKLRKNVTGNNINRSSQNKKQ